MREFKINQYITLKLEGGNSNIYLKGELFQQCKYLLLEIPVNNISTFEEIESIDEIAEKLDKNLENRQGRDYLSPEVEFWGHCSNLQCWFENQYDTRLLRQNLAFPLLKKLSEVGDPIAKKVFKKEIVRRLESGNLRVFSFLKENDFLDYLNNDELQSTFIENNKKLRDSLEKAKDDSKTCIRFVFPILMYIFNRGDISAEELLTDFIKKWFLNGERLVIDFIVREDYLEYVQKDDLESLFGELEVKRRFGLVLMLKILISSRGLRIKRRIKANFFNLLKKSDFSLIKIIFDMGWLEFIENDQLILLRDICRKLPEYLIKERSKGLSNSDDVDFEKYMLLRNVLMYIDSHLKASEMNGYVHFRRATITKKEAQSLKHIEKITKNKFWEIGPAVNYSIGFETQYNKVIGIYIKRSIKPIKTLPKSIKNLKFLKRLYVKENTILKLPKNFKRLESLEQVLIIKNCLKKFPKLTGSFRSLKVLDLSYNYLKSLPVSIKKLKSLEFLYLNNNRLNKLPKLVDNLESLKVLNLSNNQLKELPDSIGNLQNLESLNICYNKLEQLPQSILNLKTTQTIYISGNEIKNIPNAFKQKQ
ncbi:hypothetical protein LCGC14_1141370 [marine sediment metagenome]|uniref:Disease resistance R13L4/SHOC-2-like LRR domain-containing protein n=1 Tax=marine sediment metagenome TaxID=412755 RepID=A0A0F9M2Z9_9ZZZZ